MIPASTKQHQTPAMSTNLMDATVRGDEKEIITCIESGCDVNEQGANGRTALFWAIAHGNEAAALILIAHGADVHARDYSGDTPLRMCATRGSVAVANALIARGANVHEVGRVSQHANVSTLMGIAASYGHDAFIALLVSQGCDVKEEGLKGYTPLHYACANGLEATVLYLIDLGADVNAKRHDGITPLRCAASFDHTQIAFALISHGASMENRPRTVKRMVISGMTERQAAVRGGFLDRLKVLLDGPHGRVPRDEPKALIAYAKRFRCMEAAAVIHSYLAMRAVHDVLAGS